MAKVINKIYIEDKEQDKKVCVGDVLICKINRDYSLDEISVFRVLTNCDGYYYVGYMKSGVAWNNAKYSCKISRGELIEGIKNDSFFDIEVLKYIPNDEVKITVERDE